MITLTVVQLIEALDAKSTNYVLKGRDTYHTISFTCPFSEKHEVTFYIAGQFMTQSTAVFSSRENVNYGTISKGQAFQDKLLFWLLSFQEYEKEN